MKVTSGELTESSRLQTQGESPPDTVQRNTSNVLSRLKSIGKFVPKLPVWVASLAVTGLLVGARQLTLLEPLELGVYDWLVQLRPALPPDPRLLVVKWTEDEVNNQYPQPLKDGTVNELLAKLEQHQPAVIGLDIYRNKPYPPGSDELFERLSSSDRIISVCKLSGARDPGVPALPGVPTESVGLSDVAVDKPSSIVRRGLLYIGESNSPNCTTQLTLGFQLAINYLEKIKGIKAEAIDENHLKLGKTIIQRLSPTSGGYQKGDTNGFQILLNYRSPDTPARTVTLSDVLNNKIDPSWVKDRVVLIGSTAPSLKDQFSTPYSSGDGPLQKMPGVMIHGQVVSQLLGAALDRRSVFWFWSDWGEVLWIWGWAMTGGVLVRVIRHPGRLALAEGAALGLLLGTSVVLFLGSGWIPIVAPTLALIAASTAVLAYTSYEDYRKSLEAQQELEKVKLKAQEQEQNIAMVQALLRESPVEQSATSDVEEFADEETAIIPEEEESTAVWNPEDEEESTAVWNPEDEEESTAVWNPENEEESTAVWTPQDGNGKQTTRPQDPDRLLDRRYKINRTLAMGGFGLTYLAEDTRRPGSPECVVKLLRPARHDERFLAVARRLFRTEAEILEKLGNHSQIPQLLAYFEEDQEFYLVQEYIDGHTLSDELPADKRLQEKQVVELLKEILEVLSFIHKHNVIHRDIKPSNIIRRKLDGRVVLIDFGAVKQIQPQQQPEQENHTIAVGTSGYAPPEQYVGRPSFASDIYALGMIGIQALIGIHPQKLSYSTETNNVSWRELANISEEFAQIIDKMVRYISLERYQSADAVMEDLNKL